MDALLTAIAGFIHDNGIAGAVMAGLAWLYWSKSKRYEDVMEKRIAEGRESLTIMNSTREALDAVSDGQVKLAEGQAKLADGFERLRDRTGRGR